MMGDFTQNDQRFAVCINKWEKSHLKENSTAGLSIDATQPFKVQFSIEASTGTEVLGNVLTNIIQMQEQFRLFRYNHKANASVLAAYDKMDKELGSMVDYFIDTFGKSLKDSEVEINVLDFKSGLARQAVARQYKDYMVNIPQFLSVGYAEVLAFRDRVVDDLSELQTLLSA